MTEYEWRVTVRCTLSSVADCKRCRSSLMPRGAPFCTWCGAAQHSASPRQRLFSPPARTRPLQSSSVTTAQTTAGAVNPTHPTVAVACFDLSSLKHLRRQSLSQLVGRCVPGSVRPRLLQSMYGISQQVALLSSVSAPSFRLETDDGFSVGVEEMRTLLLAHGVKEVLCPLGWVANHYGLIVWKLASMERSFSEWFAQKALTVDNVLTELLYRYEREVNRSQRSFIKQLLEHDESSTRHVVLCISSLNPPPLISSSSSSSSSSSWIELTDGWYRVKAALDPTLQIHLESGKLFVGQKLRIFGATLIGSTEPSPPLEAYPSAALQLSINGTRRCKWDEKLGCQHCPAFVVPLSSIVAGGGVVPGVDVIVQRVYKVRYLETQADGRRISRSEGEELQASQAHQRRLEGWLEQKQREFESELITTTANANGRAALTPAQLRAALEQATSGAEIAGLLGSAGECSTLLQVLSPLQMDRLQIFQAEESARNASAVQERLEGYLSEHPEMDRGQVVPFLSLRITDCRLATASHGQLTIWRPTEHHLVDFREGARLKIFGLNAAQHSQRHLSTTSFSRWLRCPDNTVSRSRHHPRAPVDSYRSLNDLELDDRIGDGEFDCVGMLLLLGEPQHLPDNLRGAYRQQMFLSDGTSLLCATFQTDLPFKFPAVVVHRQRMSAAAAALPMLVLLRNLRFSEYDLPNQTFLARATGDTEVIPAAADDKSAAVALLRARLEDVHHARVIEEQLHLLQQLELLPTTSMAFRPFFGQDQKRTVALPGVEDDRFEDPPEMIKLVGRLEQVTPSSFVLVDLQGGSHAIRYLPEQLGSLPSLAADPLSTWQLVATEAGGLVFIELVSQPGSLSPEEPAADPSLDLASLEDLESLGVLQEMMMSSGQLQDDPYH